MGLISSLLEKYTPLEKPKSPVVENFLSGNLPEGAGIPDDVVEDLSKGAETPSGRDFTGQLGLPLTTKEPATKEILENVAAQTGDLINLPSDLANIAVQYNPITAALKLAGVDVPEVPPISKGMREASELALEKRGTGVGILETMALDPLNAVIPGLGLLGKGQKISSVARAEARFAKNHEVIRVGKTADGVHVLEELIKTPKQRARLSAYIGASKSDAKLVDKVATDLFEETKRGTGVADAPTNPKIQEIQERIYEVVEDRVVNSNVGEIANSQGRIAKTLQKWMTQEGDATPYIKPRVSLALGRIRAHDAEVNTILNRVGQDVARLPNYEDLKPILDSALKGDVDSLAQLPSEIATDVDMLARARQSMMVEAKNSKDLPIDLKTKILSEGNDWHHISYAVHSDPAVQQAKIQALRERSDKKLVAALDSILQDNPHWTVPDGEALLKGLISASGSKEDFVLGIRQAEKIMPSKLQSQTITRRRTLKDPKVKAALEEVQDPLLNHFKSVSLLYSEIEHNAMFRDIADDLIDRGMATVLPPTEKGSGPFTVPINGTQSKYGYMSEVYTTPEIAASINRTKDLSRFSTLMTVNMFSKVAKTAGSTVTQARNIWAAPAFLGMQGFLPSPKSFNLWREGTSEAFKTGVRSAKATEIDEKFLKTMELGLAGQSVDFGDFQRYYAPLDRKLKEMIGPGKTLPQKLLKKGKETSELTMDFYRSVDDGVRHAMYYLEKERAMKVGMAEEAAAQYAADVVPEMMTMYSQVPKLVSATRDIPMFGPFVSFPMETARISKNTLKRAVAEMTSTDPMVQAIGRQRMAGFIGTTVVAPQAIRGTLKGIAHQTGLESTTLNEDRSLNLFLNDYMQNSQTVVLGKKDRGHYKVLDLSFVDPFQYPKKSVIALNRAYLRGDDITETAEAVLREIAQPIVTPEIMFGQILESASKIKRDDLKGADVGTEIMKSMASGVIPDAFYRTLPNLMKSFNLMDETLPTKKRSGIPYNPATEIAGSLGIRIVDVLPVRDFEYKTSRYQSVVSKTSSEWKKVKVESDNLEYRESKQRELITRHREKAEELLTYVSGLRDLGYHSYEIERLLRGRGVSKRSASYFVRDKVPPLFFK